MFIIYKSTADLIRLNREAADSDREKYSTIYRGLRLNIQPAGLEYVVTQPDGALGKIFRAFTTYSGCQIGMRVVTSGTVTVSGSMYEITGVEPYEGGLGRHWELLLRKSTS